MHPEFLRGHLEGLPLAVPVDDPGHGYALSQRLAVAARRQAGSAASDCKVFSTAVDRALGVLT
jgi:hypothetical protein